MSNTFFKFKEFTVHQEKSIMKVCTDACILGAWTAQQVKTEKKILDIGAGTGLLSLMLAQNSESLIDAIEIDPQSADQAKENISQSPWPDRIQLIDGDIRHSFLPEDYDFIISNPPFYNSDLRSQEERKNMAKHNESLGLEELIVSIRSHLKPTGRFSVLLPFHRSGYFEKLSESNGFFLREKLAVRQTSAHTPFRSICLFSYQKPERFISNELIIKNKDGINSPDFNQMMRDYYE